MTWSTKDRNDCKPHRCLLSPRYMLLWLFSCQVASDSLRPHGLWHTMWHARLPCPSPAPGVYSDSCPLVIDAEPFSAVPFFAFSLYQISIFCDESALCRSSVQLLSRIWLCNPMDCSTPGLPVHHQSFKLGFSSVWTENIQMYKLGLEMAEEPEIKLPMFAGS